MKKEKKELINEHDYTKKMLDIMRYGLVTEDFQDQTAQNPNGQPHDEGSDVITPTDSDPNYAEEIKKFSDTVDPRVQVSKFKIYPRDRDVQFEGRLDSGINFFMSIKAMKLSISITDDQNKAIKIYMDDDLLTTLQKLSGYYDNWSKEWAQKLTTDYKTAQ